MVTLTQVSQPPVEVYVGLELVQIGPVLSPFALVPFHREILFFESLISLRHVNY